MTKLPWEWVEERLLATHNYWLATVESDARPYVRPVWCVWNDGVLVFTASPTSRKVRNLLANPRVSVHLELPREVVVLEGAATPREPSKDLLAAYEAKYNWQPPPSQGWYGVVPGSIYAADEATYPSSSRTFAL